MDTPKLARYMPSRRFVGVICLVAGLALLFIAITSRFGARSSFGGRGNAVTLSSEGTIGDAIARDSNKNGISDWEEILWGLDPETDGPDNKKAIEKKKREAGVTVTEDAENVTQTELFSRSLLSTILALQQSGSLTPEAVTNLAASMGDTVDAKHADVPVWTEADLHVAADGAAAKAAYKTALKAAIDRYSDAGMGTELSILAQGFADGGADALKGLRPIGSAYSRLAEEVIALPTPRSVAEPALAVANNTAIMGATLGQMSHFYDDALAGMVGLDDYLRANEATDEATDKLAAYFGI